jgi:hypothetical protein
MRPYSIVTVCHGGASGIIRVRFEGKSGHHKSAPPCPLVTDSVEKVGRPFGFYAFGRFGAAEVSRLLGFAAAGMAASSMQTRLLYL